MFDLEARVHLEKVEPGAVAVALDQELDGPGIPIAGRARRGHRGVTHPGTQGRRQRRRRALLDNLLMAALDRAFALEEVDDVAVASAKTWTSTCRGRSINRST